MCIPPSSLDPGYTRSPKRLNIQIILVVLPASADGFWIGKLYETNAEFAEEVRMDDQFAACWVLTSII